MSALTSRELGTEPVAVATGCFQRENPLATASGSVPNRLTDTRILSCEAKPTPKIPEPALAGDRFEWFHPARIYDPVATAPGSVTPSSPNTNYQPKPPQIIYEFRCYATGSANSLPSALCYWLSYVSTRELRLPALPVADRGRSSASPDRRN